ncbi:MAG: hypothetical protein HQ557_02075 [Bacteroidetes bacterium]|nr:hypothetical protein [Bacteroidota bacterium]
MIEFQYFNGCPNADTTLSNLKEVMNQLNLPNSELFLIEVPDISAAEAVHFQGSPTILVNGIDMYPGVKPDSFNFSCRVYQFDYVAESRGWETSGHGHRYDSDLSEELYFDSSDPQFFAVPIPVQYILDTDDNEDGFVEIEYFMSINDDSYIKNRLHFSITPE